MDSAKAKTVERGNPITKGVPVLPPPPIPKKVLESNKPLPYQGEKEVKPSSSDLLDRKVKKYKDDKPIGEITLYIYKNRPYEAKFEGQIAGFEMSIAIRAMRKQYKLWKLNLLKQGGK